MMTKCNNVDEMILTLLEIDDTLKSSVISDIEATELHMLLNQLDIAVTREHEKVIRNKSLVAKAFDNIKSLEEVKKHNNEFYKAFYTSKEFAEFTKIIHKSDVKTDTKIKYEIEFKEDKIGSYTIYFDNKVYPINIFKPNKIYANTRIVKKLVEDPESYIESYNIDKDYIIIRNDKLNKFVIFTRTDKNTDTFNYLAPEEYCKDTDRI